MCVARHAQPCAKGTIVFDAPQKLFRLLAVGFALIGCGLLAGAFLSYRSTEAFLRTAATATGEVIGYERHN
jgi:hypothetical protein